MQEYHKIQTVWHRDPSTDNKTLLENVWAEPEFEYLAGNTWVFTEKVDGTNIRVMIRPAGDPSSLPEVSFGGKTDNASLPAQLVTKLESRFHPQRARLGEMFPASACLYGEGYGARIQKGGGNYRSDQDFVLFDVKVGDWWLDRDSQLDIAGKLDLDVVPVIGEGALHDMIAQAREGFCSRWGSFRAEGIVARPLVELKNRKGGRIITKIKCKDFALQP